MANMRRHLDQLLKPAKYNPANYAGLSMEEDPLAGLDMRAELQAALDGAPDPWKDLEGVDMSAELQRDIEALEPWKALEDIEVIEPWEDTEDIEDLLRT